MGRVEQLRELYDEIHAWVARSDPEAVPRKVVPEALDSEVLLVGQAPGRGAQRLSGLPYMLPSGDLSRAGRRLDGFLGRFGYTIHPDEAERRYAYSTDVCQARGGDDEIDVCRDWLEREVELVQPRVIVLLGLVPAREILGHYGCLAASRSRPQLGELFGVPYACSMPRCEVDAVVVHHPSGAFEHPSARATYIRAAEMIEGLLASYVLGPPVAVGSGFPPVSGSPAP